MITIVVDRGYSDGYGSGHGNGHGRGNPSGYNALSLASVTTTGESRIVARTATATCPHGSGRTSHHDMTIGDDRSASYGYGWEKP